MELFIDTVENLNLQKRLFKAIHGKGAFRRFKNILSDYPVWQEKWYEFRDARQKERVIEWLNENGFKFK